MLVMLVMPVKLVEKEILLKGQLDTYNYGSRYWNTGIESIGRIGNGIGLPLMLGRGLRGPKPIRGFR